MKPASSLGSLAISRCAERRASGRQFQRASRTRPHSAPACRRSQPPGSRHLRPEASSATVAAAPLRRESRDRRSTGPRTERRPRVPTGGMRVRIPPPALTDANPLRACAWSMMIRVGIACPARLSAWFYRHGECRGRGVSARVRRRAGDARLADFEPAPRPRLTRHRDAAVNVVPSRDGEADASSLCLSWRPNDLVRCAAEGRRRQVEFESRNDECPLPRIPSAKARRSE